MGEWGQFVEKLFEVNSLSCAMRRIHLVFLLVAGFGINAWSQQAKMPELNTQYDKDALPSRLLATINYAFDCGIWDPDAAVNGNYRNYFAGAFGWSMGYNVNRRWTISGEFYPFMGGARVSMDEPVEAFSVDSITYFSNRIGVWKGSIFALQKIFLTLPYSDHSKPGLWVDFGAGLEWPSLFRYKLYHKNSKGGSVREKYQGGGLPVQYVGLGRIGYKFFALTAKYRFNDYFKPDSPYPAFPKWTFGFDFIIYVERG